MNRIDWAPKPPRSATEILQITTDKGYATTSLRLEGLDGVGNEGGTYVLVSLQQGESDLRTTLTKSEAKLIGRFLSRWGNQK